MTDRLHQTRRRVNPAVVVEAKAQTVDDTAVIEADTDEAGDVPAVEM